MYIYLEIADQSQDLKIIWSGEQSDGSEMGGGKLQTSVDSPLRNKSQHEEELEKLERPKIDFFICDLCERLFKTYRNHVKHQAAGYPQ